MRKAGDALFDRQGFGRDAASRHQGLLSLEAALPADACRYRLEVPRHVHDARGDGQEVWLGADRPQEPGRCGQERQSFRSRLGPSYPDHEDGRVEAGRDEEKSRAKERIFSFRDSRHRWDPKNQRPELWDLYNARKNKGESIRVFPLSNWTELDIWQYIHKEKIEIVPLYFAAERPVVYRDGQIIMVDDERMRLNPGEKPEMRKIRFRTLGCYPLTGAIDSDATSLLDIVEEMLVATSSERQGRVIDKDASASMEKKKQEGYF
jgi:hypothetical protein